MKDVRKMIEQAGLDNEPIFVLRAKDKLSLVGIYAYYEACCDAETEESHREGIDNIIDEFAAWQENNPSKVKLPD